MSSDGSKDPAAASSSTMLADQDASLVGEVLDGRYRIIKKLGEGGMGEVYAAEHVHIEKRVAVKLLRPEIVSNKEAVSRFRQEARSASSIGHKNIIAIEDFGSVPDGRIYLCMELLNGAPLNDMIKEPMAQERLLNILIQTGHGLAAAHAKGIVHRDMKPENIFVTIGAGGEDIPKILDFGIAKVAGNDGQNNLTRTGTIFGTPYYMAPEQALGQGVDARVDIYAMGVITYEVFAGSLPFQGESFMGILTQHITTDPEPVAQRAARAGRQLPPGLAEVITHCLQKDPDRRFRTMDELVQQLVQIYRGMAGSGMSSYMDAYVPPPTSAMQVVPGSQPNLPQMSGHMPGYGAPLQGHPGQIGGGMAPPMAGAVGQSYPDPRVTPVPGSMAMSASGSAVAMPKKGSKLALIFSLLAVLAVGGGVAALVLVDKGDKPGPANGDGSQGSGGGSQAVVTPGATPDAAPVVAAPPDAAPVAAVTPDAADVPTRVAPVTVLINPSTRATIFEGAKALGVSPQMVKVVPGETRTLTLKAKGYKDATVRVDGTVEELAVAMDRIGGGTPTSPGHGEHTTTPPTHQTTTPTQHEQTAAEKLKEFCKKNPGDSRCLMMDDP